MKIQTLFRYLDTQEIPGTEAELAILATRISELVALNNEKWVYENRERLLAEWRIALTHMRCS